MCVAPACYDGIRNQGETLVELLTQHLHATPVPPSEAIGQPVSPDLEALALSCLAKDPNERPADGGALWTALESCEVDGNVVGVDHDGCGGGDALKRLILSDEDVFPLL